jgi:hypothetical protein
VAVLAGGEGSGPLYPPQEITEACFSAGETAAAAYAQAGLGPGDIDYWGLYDCFPICLIRCACKGAHRAVLCMLCYSFSLSSSLGLLLFLPLSVIPEHLFHYQQLYGAMRVQENLLSG